MTANVVERFTGVHARDVVVHVVRYPYACTPDAGWENGSPSPKTGDPYCGQLHDRELEGIAYSLNGSLDLPLPDSEVRGILRSVYRYRARWRALGHAPSWIARQSARGRNGGAKSGAAKRSRVRERDLRIVVLRDAGLSQREVAAVMGVSRDVVRGAADRLARGGGG